MYFTSHKKNAKSTELYKLGAFCCEETRKRCVDIGKNAKKVRKSITDFLDQFDNFTYKLFIMRKLFE